MDDGLGVWVQRRGKTRGDEIDHVDDWTTSRAAPSKEVAVSAALLQCRSGFGCWPMSFKYLMFSSLIPFVFIVKPIMTDLIPFAVIAKGDHLHNMCYFALGEP